MGSIPLVSVIMPAYNTAGFIAAAIGSVLMQECPLEVLVVDDGSTDGTAGVVRAIADPRLRYFSRRNTGGPAGPRNLGIREARGELICLFDSDDLMAPGKLVRQATFMRERPMGLSATNFRKFVADPQETAENFLDHYLLFQRLLKRLGGGPEVVIPGPDAYDLLFFENFIGTSSVMMRRGELERAGFFDEGLKSGDDLDMWFRLARLGDVGFLDIVGHFYRIRSTGLSVGSRKTVLLNRIQVIRNQIGPGMTRRQLRQSRRLMAQYWLGIGYEYRQEGNLSGARHSFTVSFVTHPSLVAARGLASTCLPGLRRQSPPGSAEA